MMYKAFGLFIASDIALPPLITADKSISADIKIEYAKVDKNGLVAPKVIEPNCHTAPNELWFHIPQIAWFYVTNGNHISIEAEAGADEQSIRLYLLGTCIGALMHQRKRLVLHGNAVRIGDKCAIFAGTSGMGKSTLAAAFLQRGYSLLADDLAVLDGHGYVQPAYPQIKIWQDAAEKLGVDTQHLKQIRLQIDKYAYPLNEYQFCSVPLPVRKVYILSTHNRDTIEFSSITGANKFVPLKNQTYRKRHLQGLGLKQQQLKHCALLANKICVTRITRSKQGCEINKLVDLVEADLRNDEYAA